MTTYTPDQLLNLPLEKLGELTQDQVEQRKQLIQREKAKIQVYSTPVRPVIDNSEE